MTTRNSQAAASEKSAIGIATSLELHSCTQVCRAFFRGRCLKDNDTTRPVGDPMRYSETHDKPKGEVKCCSILPMDDALFHKSFTKCRYKMIGEECQYICSNEEVM